MRREPFPGKTPTLVPNVLLCRYLDGESTTGRGGTPSWVAGVPGASLPAVHGGARYIGCAKDCEPLQLGEERCRIRPLNQVRADAQEKR